MKFTLLTSTLATAMLATALPSFAQTPAPMAYVVRYQVKRDRIPEFEEVEKQIAGSFKKAASADQYRVVYRDVVGNTGEYWVLTPLSKFAERDADNPYYSKISTEQERAARGARLAQYIESVRTSVERYASDLSVTSPGVPFPPTYARYIRVRVRPGTTDQLIATVKADVVPALKKMSGAELRVRQTVFGGNADEFTVAAGFEKFAELDDTTALPKAMGAETFRKFEEKMQAIETNVEEYIVAYQKDLSYYPSATATTSSH
jgi:hypothetical protein